MANVKIEWWCDDAELWSRIFGAEGTSWEWWTGERYLSGDWETPGVVRLTIQDPDDEDEPPVSRDIDLELLIAAVQAAPIHVQNDVMNDNVDAGSADCILQIAVLGEIVYG